MNSKCISSQWEIHNSDPTIQTHRSYLASSRAADNNLTGKTSNDYNYNILQRQFWPTGNINMDRTVFLGRLHFKAPGHLFSRSVQTCAAPVHHRPQRHVGLRCGISPDPHSSAHSAALRSDFRRILTQHLPEAREARSKNSFSGSGSVLSIKKNLPCYPCFPS